MDSPDIVLVIIEFIFAVSLYILAGIAEQIISSKWKLCYAAPLVVGVAFASLYGADVCLLGVYLGALVLLAGFFWERKGTRRLSSIAAGILILASVPICLFHPAYRAVDYVSEFKEGFEIMERYYLLSRHKGIDWDALYEEYLPRFQEAKKRHDAVENCIAWHDFCLEFHDGHVDYGAKDEEIEKRAKERVFGNDYGLALMTLADGRTVAVNVDAESAPARAGIHNGTVVTGWDGSGIKERKMQLERTVFSFPDKENEAFYSALLVAGTGDEQVEIAWINDAGVEQRTEFPRQGSYVKRLEDTLDILHRGIEAGNLAWLGDGDTRYLRVKMMMYDEKSYNSGDHSPMQEEIREKLTQLKEEGVTRLVIDLRSNGGGSPQFVMALASMFAPEGEHTVNYDGVWDEENKCFAWDEATGRYVAGPGIHYQGEYVWGDREIVLLVNAMTVSAGDYMAWLMSGFDNVTVVGFTRSNSSCQAVRGIGLSEGGLSFSAVPNLNADGSIFIDTDATRTPTMPLDVEVPFDEAAVHALFDEGEDYLLQYITTLFD